MTLAAKPVVDEEEIIKRRFVTLTSVTKGDSPLRIVATLFYDLVQACSSPDISVQEAERRADAAIQALVHLESTLKRATDTQPRIAEQEQSEIAQALATLKARCQELVALEAQQTLVDSTFPGREALEQSISSLQADLSVLDAKIRQTDRVMGLRQRLLQAFFQMLDELQLPDEVLLQQSGGGGDA